MLIFKSFRNSWKELFCNISLVCNKILIILFFNCFKLEYIFQIQFWSLHIHINIILSHILNLPIGLLISINLYMPTNKSKNTKIPFSCILPRENCIWTIISLQDRVFCKDSKEGRESMQIKYLETCLSWLLIHLTIKQIH